MLELTREGQKKFKPDAELYIRPMYWAEHGSLMSPFRPTRIRRAFASASTRPL